jgi:glycine/D-amino acid oxidase-like deaminating enzyme
MHIAVVGTGISGCVTAWALTQRGHRVTLVSRGPDPRIRSDDEHHSATWNGSGARFITALEARPYTDRPDAFTHTVWRGGWLAGPHSEYRPREQTWLKQRLTASTRLARRYYYPAGANALHYWQQWIERCPDLFEHTDLHSAGVIRLYNSHSALLNAQQEHQNAGAICQRLPQRELHQRLPRLESAYQQSHLIGGLAVEGISLNVQALIRNILDSLTRRDVTIHWQTPIERIKQNRSGEVTDLETSRGFLNADHYVLCTGAYAPPGLLENCPANGAIGGVAGRWLYGPRPEGWDVPLKIHTTDPLFDENREPAMDLSLIPLHDPHTGRPMWAVGGGYLYLGEPPYANRYQTALDAIDTLNRKCLQQFLDLPHLESLNTHTCVRSFSVHDIPVSVTLPCVHGGKLLIKTGHNTGTTALAPVIAQEAVQALDNN